MPPRKSRKVPDILFEAKLPDIPIVKDICPFDAKSDANFLWMALQGGDRELEVVEVLTHRSNRQRQEIAASFLECYGQDLLGLLKMQMGDHMHDVFNALFLLPEVHDAVSIHEAIQGNLPDEETLLEIICTRTNAELEALRDAYTTLYQRDLVEDVTSKSSGDFRRLMMAIALGIRDEDTSDATDPIQLKDQARLEAQLLLEPISEKLPASQVASTFVIMLANPSYAQLRMTLKEFERVAKAETEKIISRSIPPDISPALLTIVRIAKSKEGFFAENLQKALRSEGQDKRLIRLIVSRSEKDLGNIRDEFQKLYNTSLDTVITGENICNYRSVLAAMIRG
ncbi:hypothetical protein RvY_10528 [Ramazzottius varieornatus]|uniref:Annexin n=1 Tax=Ramazzottius varieornatus TaxID=947166 RepID=A0A1D1VD37_RAMVA|nr:hypothetical protein RvY_10528 [Ramazzottius varieornatus]